MHNIYMKLRTFYIQNEQERFLRKLDETTVSEHIRRAIDEYIHRKKKELLNISTSKS